MPYFKDTAINKITPTNIRQWQNTIKDDTNSKANQYLRAINTQISCIFNFAVRYYNLPKNPVKLCDPIGSKKGQELNFFTLDEFNQFIKKLILMNHITLYLIFYFGLVYDVASC